jgi:hypothetical protein
MRDASFGPSGGTVGPLTLDVRPGERAARLFGSAREANVVALLSAGIVKATTGCVLLDQYDPRIQPVHCKRIAGFVPHAALPLEETEFERYVSYRAALWSVDPVRAIAHAKLLMDRLDGMHEAFAYPLVGALVGNPRILVLDRPQPAYAAHIIAVTGSRAVFSTHVNAAAAERFSASASQEAFA